MGRLLDFKQQFFDSNDSKLEEFRNIASLYRSQPRRLVCKNCEYPLDLSASNRFVKLDVEYCLCARCGHCNGAHEDTEAFCRALYTDDHGQNYARNYTAADAQQYKNRVAEIYVPKAQFLKDALAELGERDVRLADFGAGAGYFVSAAIESGFTEVTGYEPSETLVNLGNAMIGKDRLIRHDLSEIVPVIERSDATVASFVGVLEHVQQPREVLNALSHNDRIKYVFFLVPLFSPTVVLETVFENVMPRHLVGRHTHLYTESSIQHFCDEFGFARRSEWWFGLDICDLYRNVLVSLRKADAQTVPLQAYWSEQVMPLIDKLQGVLDEAQACSEVHMLLEKKP